MDEWMKYGNPIPSVKQDISFKYRHPTRDMKAGNIYLKPKCLKCKFHLVETDGCGMGQFGKGETAHLHSGICLVKL